MEFEKALNDAIENAQDFKQACQAQIISSTHYKDPSKTMRSIQASYEASETMSLLNLYIANRSPVIRDAIKLAKHSAEQVEKECTGLKKLQKTADNVCISSKRLVRSLNKLDKFISNK